MNDLSFETLTRRATLLTLGAAGLAASAETIPAEAKKKKKKGDVNKLCKKQIAPCTTFLADSCGGDPTCLGFAACCSHLGTCDTTGFFVCLVTNTA